jgi:adenosine kinase
MVLTYTKEQFLECIQLADVIIMNDAEWLKSETFGITPEKLHHQYQNKVLIQTLGEKGSRFITPQGIYRVGVPHVDKVVEMTGAGDAFRAGLIKAFLDGASWPEAGTLGAALAAYCIQQPGGQGYAIYSPEEVYARAKDVKVSEEVQKK